MKATNEIVLISTSAHQLISTSDLEMSFQLADKLEFKVKFHEVDPLGIVWHGHYLRYFEDGREAFGHRYDLNYLDIYNHGYIAPIVTIHCDYKKSLLYGEKAIIETTYTDS